MSTKIQDLPTTHPLRAALDVYSAALDAHRCDYTQYDKGFRTCVCGRTFDTPNGCGLHITAEHKRAEKEFDRSTEGMARKRTRA